jgi:hypothetical protein
MSPSHNQELEKPIEATGQPEIISPRRRVPSFVALAAGVLLGILLFALFAHFAGRSSLWNRFSSVLTGRTTTLDTSAPAVVERIRKLSRLETVVYSIDKIVQGDREYPVLPSFLTGDKLLLIAHGEVMAGIDLSQLQPADVTIRKDTVSIHIPAPQVLSTRIDNQQTRVYSRLTGLLVTPDPNLESVVRQAAEQQITQAAISEGILDKARQNAQASITALLYGLGFHTVDVH